jgi:hypothetical protein
MIISLWGIPNYITSTYPHLGAVVTPRLKKEGYELRINETVNGRFHDELFYITHLITKEELSQNNGVDNSELDVSCNRLSNAIKKRHETPKQS